MTLLSLGLLALWGCEAADGPVSLPPLVNQVRSLAPGQVEVIHSFAEGESPEGIAIARQGHLYVSLRGGAVDGVRASSVVRIDPGGGPPEVLATLDEDVPEALPGALGVRIDPETGAVVSLTSEHAAFDTPTSLAFGTGGKTDRKSVYVVNAALRDDPRILPGSGPGIVQVGVGEPGFQGP